jgi:hypothetical protein
MCLATGFRGFLAMLWTFDMFEHVEGIMGHVTAISCG